MAYDGPSFPLCSEVVVRYRDQIRKLEPEIKAILKQEVEEKQVNIHVHVVNECMYTCCVHCVCFMLCCAMYVHVHVCMCVCVCVCVCVCACSH